MIEDLSSLITGSWLFGECSYPDCHSEQPGGEESEDSPRPVAARQAGAAECHACGGDTAVVCGNYLLHTRYGALLPHAFYSSMTDLPWGDGGCKPSADGGPAGLFQVGTLAAHLFLFFRFSSSLWF
jgi:hypothetical protein